MVRKHFETPAEMVEWLEAEFDRAKQPSPVAPPRRQNRRVAFFLAGSAILLGVMFAAVLVWDTAKWIDGQSFGIGFGSGAIAGFLFYHYDQKQW